MNDMLVITFTPRDATLKKVNGTFVRRFTARSGTTIVQATVSGTGNDALVTLNYANGRADVYRATGSIVRQL